MGKKFAKDVSPRELIKKIQKLIQLNIKKNMI